MADQQRWFKLWESALSDPDLCSLSPDLRWAWAALGAYTKTHGTKGVLVTRLDNPALAAVMGVTKESVLAVLKVLPNITLEEGKTRDGKWNVTWKNWQKYQVDSSASRTSEWRRSKKRGEERRREEKRTTTLLHPPPSVSDGFAAWPPEWGPVRKLIEEHPFLTVHRDWLCDLAWWQAEDERLSGSPKPLNELLASAVAYCITKGYKPTSRVGLRSKLHNCMGFEAERSQREAQRKSVTGGR